MSAAELRQAAETLRKTAGALHDHAEIHGDITGGPVAWWSKSFLSNAIAAYAPGSRDEEDLDVLDSLFALAGEWFHLMHHDVGTALADALDAEAEKFDETRALVVRSFGEDNADDFLAEPSLLAVARSINGGAA